ncbi:uncharacterized protein LOC107979351 isoform X1 [Cricetulus griseus]|nr:uncharacterized protein LOC107979351 isoform X1 [Cricetulus griseus]
MPEFCTLLQLTAFPTMDLWNSLICLFAAIRPRKTVKTGMVTRTPMENPPLSGRRRPWATNDNQVKNRGLRVSEIETTVEKGPVSSHQDKEAPALYPLEKRSPCGAHGLTLQSSHHGPSEATFCSAALTRYLPVFSSRALCPAYREPTLGCFSSMTETKQTAGI